MKLGLSTKPKQDREKASTLRILRYGVALCFIISLVWIFLLSQTRLMNQPRYYEAASAFRKVNSCSTISSDFPPLKTTDRGIPYLLHHVAVGLVNPVPYIQLIKNCRLMNRNFLHVFWTQKSVTRFLKQHYPQYLSLYNKYQKRGTENDFYRVVLLYHYGGVYINLDVDCVRPFVPYLEKYTASCLIGREQEVQSQLLRGVELFPITSAMATRPRHPFFRYVLESMVRSMNTSSSLPSSSSSFFVKRLWEYASKKQLEPNVIALLPAHVFSPSIDARYSGRYSFICFPLLKWALSASRRRACDKLSEFDKSRKAPSKHQTTILTHRFIDLNGYEKEGNVCRAVPGLTTVKTEVNKASVDQKQA